MEMKILHLENLIAERQEEIEYYEKRRAFLQKRLNELGEKDYTSLLAGLYGINIPISKDEEEKNIMRTEIEFLIEQCNYSIHEQKERIDKYNQCINLIENIDFINSII